MNYEFPIIKNIDDVLPFVEGRDEFVVADRGEIIIVNYNVELPDTFSFDSDNQGGIIRRECRGLVFSKNGNVVNRRFHKFFNLNQKDETQSHVIDFTCKHKVKEKLDGSMVSPVTIGNDVKFITKMGLTEVAEQCNKFCKNNLTKQQWIWIYEMLEDGKTPIFEYVGPDNRIVIHYSKENIVLLAVRDNYTGKYEFDISERTPFEIAPTFDSVKDVNQYVNMVRGQEDREGVVILFENGHMLKIKSDHYVKIHTLMDEIRHDKNIIELLYDNALDDVFPILDEKRNARVRDVCDEFLKIRDDKVHRLKELFECAKNEFGADPKRIALDMVPNLRHKKDASFIFNHLKGKTAEELVDEEVRKNFTRNVRYDEMMKWMRL